MEPVLIELLRNDGTIWCLGPRVIEMTEVFILALKMGQNNLVVFPNEVAK